MSKERKKLTIADVRNAKPKEKDYKLYDVGGLRLLVRKTGTKVWQYPYRFNEKHNIYTIGRFDLQGRAGTVTLAEARNACYEIKSLLDKGIDPNTHKRMKKDTKQETTFEVLGREWHARGTWVSKHSKNILRSLEDDVFPLIGQKQVNDINGQDVIAVLSRIADRGAYDVAKRVSQRCESIFDYAIIKGVCNDNPALGRSKFIQKPLSQPRPHLKAHQLPEFMKRLEVYHGRDYVRLAMKLLVLTFVRPGELRNAKWSEIYEDKALWIIPAEKMKMRREHVVPLSAQALEVLSQLREITGHRDFLFPSTHNNHKPISDVTLLKVLQIMGYVGDEKIVPHGFRHTASTILNEKGYNPDHIERQLAHVDKNRVRGVYNHAEYLDDRRRMMQDWANYLDREKEKQ